MMTDLFAARSQMAISLGFHILFAVAGMAMPLLMLIAEVMHRRTKQAHYLELAKRWSKGTAILFAVGAVSGTVLSFELGLLWPTFMKHAGPLIGMPFSLEGFAFFLEAIFLGIYLYGRDRVPPPMHLFSAAVVAVSGLASGIFVVSVNAWMNTPAGFVVRDGAIIAVDLWEAFFNPAFPTQAAHMAIAAYSSVAFAVLGIHAYNIARFGNTPFHQAAFNIALGVAVVATPLQILTGDFAAKHVAEHQPTKFAAMESLFKTTRGAPLTLGGFPDEQSLEVHGAIEIPKALSLMTHYDPNHEIVGLEAFNRNEWPPVAVVHWAFQLMIGCGVLMLIYAAWSVLNVVRKRSLINDRKFLTASILVSPLGLIALEAGWTVTEVGRQPWIIRGFLRTADAVTPVTGLQWSLVLFTALYIALGAIVIAMLKRHVFASNPGSAPKAKP